MALKLITPAVDLAVSLFEARLHLRVSDASEDALITAYIGAATEMAEQATGRAIMPQTWELTEDTFPSALRLTRVPVVSITSLNYTDTSGLLQTLSASAYTLANACDYSHALVQPAYATSWPSTRTQTGAVALRYQAGYANAASVPESIKAWIKLMVGAMFENREAETTNSANVGSTKLGYADRLLDRYVVWA